MRLPLQELFSLSINYNKDKNKHNYKNRTQAVKYMIGGKIYYHFQTRSKVDKHGKMGDGGELDFKIRYSKKKSRERRE